MNFDNQLQVDALEKLQDKGLIDRKSPEEIYALCILFST